MNSSSIHPHKKKKKNHISYPPEKKRSFPLSSGQTNTEMMMILNKTFISYVCCGPWHGECSSSDTSSSFNMRGTREREWWQLPLRGEEPLLGGAQSPALTLLFFNVLWEIEYELTGRKAPSGPPFHLAWLLQLNAVPLPLAGKQDW